MIMRLPTPADPRRWLRRLSAVFDAMDTAYARAAVAAGFHCTGCEDNCCRTRFHHHTLLEYLALQHALAALAPETRLPVMERAAAVCRHADGGAAGAEGSMCPLNMEGRCGVYALRPMICRLHGIPHELHRPAGEILCGPGCDAFYSQCAQQHPAPIDRTPHYRRLAALEGELRRELGFAGKIRMTVAEMVLSIGGGKMTGTK